MKKQSKWIARLELEANWAIWNLANGQIHATTLTPVLIRLLTRARAEARRELRRELKPRSAPAPQRSGGSDE